MNIRLLAQFANIALGIWLMAAPAVLGYDDPAQTMGHIIGPLTASFATIALWEVTRPLRWVNLLLGFCLLLAPWVLGYPLLPLLNSTLVGLITMAFALVRGKVRSQFGGGWSVLWSK
jgi:hypothetical protein